MPTDVALISDTHLYSDFSSVPEWVRKRVRAADHTIHSGDFVSNTSYKYFRDLAEDAGGKFTAVQGNSDLISSDLPDVIAVDIEDVRIVATHPPGIGDAFFEADAYEMTIVEFVRENDGQIGVAGHTHRIIDQMVDGVRLLNPGSATAAAPAKEATMLHLTVDGDDVTVRHKREGETIAVQ